MSFFALICLVFSSSLYARINPDSWKVFCQKKDGVYIRQILAMRDNPDKFINMYKENILKYDNMIKVNIDKIKAIKLYSEMMNRFPKSVCNYLYKNGKIDESYFETILKSEFYKPFHRLWAGLCLYHQGGNEKYAIRILDIFPSFIAIFETLKDNNFKTYLKYLLQKETSVYIEKEYFPERYYMLTSPQINYVFQMYFTDIIKAIQVNLSEEEGLIFTNYILSQIGRYKNIKSEVGFVRRHYKPESFHIEGFPRKNKLYKKIIRAYLQHGVLEQLQIIEKNDKKGIFTDTLKAETKKWLEQREKQNRLIRETFLKENNDQKKDTQSTK